MTKIQGSSSVSVSSHRDGLGFVILVVTFQTAHLFEAGVGAQCIRVFGEFLLPLVTVCTRCIKDQVGATGNCLKSSLRGGCRARKEGDSVKHNYFARKQRPPPFSCSEPPSPVVHALHNTCCANRPMAEKTVFGSYAIYLVLCSFDSKASSPERSLPPYAVEGVT